jgi:hypothetical protein
MRLGIQFTKQRFKLSRNLSWERSGLGWSSGLQEDIQICVILESPECLVLGKQRISCRLDASNEFRGVRSILRRVLESAFSLNFLCFY